MGLTDDFETSLQVLRGFDTDITIEVNEIKVLTKVKHDTGFIMFMIAEWVVNFINIQRSVASSSKRSAIRFVDLKRRRYYFPLMVQYLLSPLEAKL